MKKINRCRSLTKWTVVLARPKTIDYLCWAVQVNLISISQVVLPMKLQLNFWIYWKEMNHCCHPSNIWFADSSVFIYFSVSFVFLSFFYSLIKKYSLKVFPFIVIFCVTILLNNFVRFYKTPSSNPKIFLPYC